MLSTSLNRNDTWEAFARVKSWHSCWKNPKWTFYPGQISVLFTIYTLGSSSCKWHYRPRCPKWTRNLKILSSFGGLFLLLSSLSVLHSTAATMPICCKFKWNTKLWSEQIFQLKLPILKKKKSAFFLLSFFNTIGSTLAAQLIMPLFIWNYFSPFTTHIHLGLIQYYSAWRWSKTANNFCNGTISTEDPKRAASLSKNPLIYRK